MKELKNLVALAQMIELYKSGKISELALEKELTLAFAEAVAPVDILVKIIKNDGVGTSGRTFGVTSLPETAGTKNRVTIIVDNESIKNVLSPKDVLTLIALEAKDIQNTLKEYSKFIIKHTGSEVSVLKTLELFLELRKESIERLRDNLNELYEKLLENKTIVSEEDLDKELEKLESTTDRLDVVIEHLIVTDALPKLFVEKAQELARTLTGISNQEKIDDTNFKIAHEEPVMNQFQQQRRALSDGTYQKPGKKIAYDYKPDTNQ
jgi:hypothetical protein